MLKIIIFPIKVRSISVLPILLDQPSFHGLCQKGPPSPPQFSVGVEGERERERGREREREQAHKFIQRVGKLYIYIYACMYSIDTHRQSDR